MYAQLPAYYLRQRLFLHWYKEFILFNSIVERIKISGLGPIAKKSDPSPLSRTDGQPYGRNEGTA